MGEGLSTHFHDGPFRRVERIGLERGPLVALLVGRADGVRPVREQGRPRHTGYSPTAAAQVWVRSVRCLCGPAVVMAAGGG
jgi:hypothetical protein